MEMLDGSYKGVYCHNDGYLSHNGAILLDHYQDRSKVESLINYGDLSCLRPNVEPNGREVHNFEHRQSDVCVFYGRDRHEPNVEAREVDLDELNLDSSWIDYTYVFGKNNVWRYFKNGELDNGLKEVEPDLNKIFEDLGFPRPDGVYGFFTPSDFEYYGNKQEAEMA